MHVTYPAYGYLLKHVGDVTITETGGMSTELFMKFSYKQSSFFLKKKRGFFSKFFL